jgi:hypothetical protein
MITTLPGLLPAFHPVTCLILRSVATMNLQCILKVFRPLPLFHILLLYSLILTCIKYNVFLIDLHTIPHDEKAKTGLEILANVFKIKS